MCYTEFCQFFTLYFILARLLQPLIPVLDHMRIIKYHTLKYVRIVKNIKYVYDTHIITQVGRKDKVHTEGLHN